MSHASCDKQNNEADVSTGRSFRVTSFWFFGASLTLSLTYYLHRLRVPLYDFSYPVNIGYRLSQGQVPYRDFDLPLTPGTFYVSAIAHNLFGWNATTNLLLTLVISLASFAVLSDILVCNNTLNPLSTSPRVRIFYLASVLAAALSGLNYILAFPFYDNMAILAVLCSLNLGIRAWKSTQPWLWVAAGSGTFLPFLFKQNIGLLYLIGVTLTVPITILTNYQKTPAICERKKILYTATGLATTVSGGIALLQISGSLRPFVSQVFIGAAQSKSLASLETYSPYQSVWVLGVVVCGCTAALVTSPRWVAVLIAWPWALFGALSAVAVFHLIKTPPNGYMPNYALPTRMLPVLTVSGVVITLVAAWRSRLFGSSTAPLALVVASVMFGAQLSQGSWGSSYALPPVVLLLGILSLAWIIPMQSRLAISIVIGAIGIFSVWTPLYAASGDRLRFVDAFTEQTTGTSGRIASIPAGPKEHIAWAELARLLDTKYLTVAEIPMEDPLPYLASPGYEPWWRCDQADRNICPSMSGLWDALLTHPPDVLLVKERTQLTAEVQPVSGAIRDALGTCYRPEFRIPGFYLVYLNLQTNDCLRRIHSQNPSIE